MMVLLVNLMIEYRLYIAYTPVILLYLYMPNARRSYNST